MTALDNLLAKVGGQKTSTQQQSPGSVKTTALGDLYNKVGAGKYATQVTEYDKKPVEQTPIIAKPKETIVTKITQNPTYQKIDQKINSAVKGLFSLPDKGIKWAQDEIVKAASQPDFNIDNNKFIKAAAETQKFIEESPVFTGEYSPFSGMQKGAAGILLGNSEEVAKTLYTRLPQKQTKIGKGIETVGEVVGMIGAMMAGGSVLRAAGLAKATLPTLFVVTGQTGASKDLDWKRRFAKMPVDAVAGYLFSLVGGSNPFTKAGLKQAGTAGTIAGAQTFVNTLTEGMTPKEAAEAATKAAIAGSLFHMAFTATNSEFRSRSGRMTPAEAKARAAEMSNDPKMKGPAANLFRAAEQAEAAGKDLEINLFAAKKSPIADLFKMDTPQGVGGTVKLVDPVTPTGPAAPKIGAGAPTAPTTPPTTQLNPLSVAPTAETSGFAAKVGAAKVGDVIDLKNMPEGPEVVSAPTSVQSPVVPEPPKTRGTVKVEGLPEGVRATASYRPDGTAGMSIHISDTLQGKGYGKQAVEQLETKLIKLGVKTVNISADMHKVDGGQSSVGFWEKMGYTKNGDVKGDFQPMTKELSPKTTDLSTMNAKFGTDNSKRMREEALAGKYENRRLDSPERIKQVTLEVENPTPESKITVYRAGKGEIAPGDFVTTNLSVVEKYINERPGSSIYQETVPLKDLLIHIKGKQEFVYAPKSEVKTPVEPKQSEVKEVKPTTIGDKPLYHGTNEKFDKFDLEKSGEVQPGDWGAGIYFADKPDIAKGFAEKAGGDIVMERYAPDVKFADGEALMKDSEFMSALDWSNDMNSDALKDYLSSKGFDGVMVKHKDNGGWTEYVVYDVEKIKTKTPESKESLPTEAAEAAITIQEGIYSGEVDAAKKLYDEMVKKGLKLPSFEELQNQVEEAQQSMVSEVEKELGSVDNYDADSPERTIIEIAQRLGNYLKAPGTVRRFTGAKRTYTDSKGNKITVGGTLNDAMDRLIFAEDIDGFGKVMNIMHENYNTAYTELSDMIKKGQIDGGDYERFKEEFRKQLDQRPTYSARPSKTAKPSRKVESPKPSKEATERIPDQPSSVEDYSELLKRQIGDVFEVVEPTSGLWQSRGNVLYLRLTGNRRGVGGPSWLQNQNVVEKVQEAGGRDVLKVIMKKVSTPSGYANTDKFIEDSKTKKDESSETRKIIEFPEMIKLVKQITGKLPQLRKMRVAGRFNPISEAITINRDIFANEKQAARTLAHEIGHLVDFLDKEVKTMSRGNLLGRLASLRGYRKQFISDEPPAERDLITPEDRKALMKRARELAKEPVEVTKTVVVGEAKIEPSEVLAIWRDNTAGEKDPDLMKYIQTLADSDKVDIAKAALKGIIPDWVKFTRKKFETITVKEIRRAPADIRAKYKDLVREEIKKRRLVSLAVVRKELKDLSHIWRPLSRTDADYMKYRNSGAELYADAISVLFNDPVRLQQDAPVFYRAFFNYLQNKPQASEAFFDAWHLLNQGEDAVLGERLRTIDEMFKNDEEKFRALQIERDQVKRDIAFELKHQLINKNQAVLDKVKQAKAKGVVINDDDNPKYLLSAYNYLGGKVKSFLDREINPWYAKLPEQGITWEEVGKYMLLERIMGERKNIANPLGLTQGTAKPTFEKMVADMGPQKAEALKSAVAKFREANKKVMEDAYKRGELYSEDLYKQISSNDTYASFRVTEYLENNVSAKIFKQVGTFKDIGNPATATLAKMIATIRATERAVTNRATINLLKKAFPEDIKLAPTRWNGRTQAPIESKDPKEALVYNYEKGKAVGYYVDPYIAETFGGMTLQNRNIVIELLKLSNSKLYRPLFITTNLRFQMRNFGRDFIRSYKNSPGLNPFAILKSYYQALSPAKRRAWGEFDQTINDMEAAGMLGATYNDSLKGVSEEDKQIDLLFRKYMGEDGVKADNFAIRKLKQLMDLIERTGNFVETIPKAAGYLRMQNDLSPQALGYYVRNMSGSPDFLTTGSLFYETSSIMLFSNAAAQGWRGDYESFTDPKTRSGYWFKSAVIDFLPKIFMWTLKLGLWGMAAKKAIEGISEYNLSHYNAIPVGVDENGKTIWVPMISDQTGQFFSGLAWKILNVMDNKPLEQGLMDIFAYIGSSVPGLSPAIETFSSTKQYIEGQNPYDSYRNRNAIPETEFEAGGWRRLKPFLIWQLQQNGFAQIIPSSSLETGPSATALEKTLNTPLLGGLAQVFLRVSDYGHQEVNKKIAAQAAKEEAIIRLDNKEMIRDAVERVQAGEDKARVMRSLIEEVKSRGEDPSETIKQVKSIQSGFEMALVKGAQDPDINSLIYAQSNKQKAAILKNIKDTSSAEDYERILRSAIMNDIISEDVIVKLRGL